MNIGIPLLKTAYTPEAFAYEKYLTNLNHKVELGYTLDPNNDINIYFLGVRPFWKICRGRAKEVHEYQSLSTPPYAKLKNLSKKLLNKKPDGRIFLNDLVCKNMNSRDNVPYIYRDMGVDESLFQIPSINPSYDVIYCGSISGRTGLMEILLNIAKFYKVIVVGKVSEDEKRTLSVENITLAGIISRKELPKIYREARFGLNFTPDIYPYNVQTSTKTLEYLASGLGVISNKYEWAENFFKKINYQPFWLNHNTTLDSKRLDDLTSCDHSIMQEYSWNNILYHSNFDGFLRDVVNESI